MQGFPRYLKMTSKGQITIPAQLRRQLGATDYFLASLSDNKLILEPVRGKSGKEAILAYARAHSQERLPLPEVQKIMAKVPFSLASQVSRLREEE